MHLGLRHISKNSFLYLLFAIVFTIGFLLGTLYSPALDNETQRYGLDTLKKTMANIVVVILSAPDNVEQRRVIRKTWLLTKGNNSIKHYFAMSTGSLSYARHNMLKEEHKIYGDLIFFNLFSDTYFRLSDKVREVFRWVNKNCDYKFVLKVDDDSFVNLDSLSKSLMRLPQEKLYWGFFDGRASVKRRGKWKESKWFLCDHYLPHALGGGYLLSQDLVNLIVSISDYLFLYQSEDVSVGTWLAPLNINRIHDPNFDTEYASRGCYNSYLVTHKQTPAMMLQKYSNLVNHGHICEKEYRAMNSYVYNWNVLPSRCCERNNGVP